MAENSGITKGENSFQPEQVAEGTNFHLNNTASEMNNVRQSYIDNNQYYPQQQQLYNHASFNQYQLPTAAAAEPVQLTTSQASLLSPQYNYLIPYDPSHYLPTSEYPLDWGVYNTASYYPDNNYVYYKQQQQPSWSSGSGDVDAKALEQSFNQLNLAQFADPNNNQLDYALLHHNSKQFLSSATNASNNKWDPKRLQDHSRSTSSRYWKSSRPGLSSNIHDSSFNPREFTLKLENARYFVIKSYSEEDIFRSIKHQVWCSTDFGNKRLNSAFQTKADADACIYLFFSVNGTGHFCGVAQMTSAVDFNTSADVWTQRKWKGQFAVQWLYVKDVPNNQLRHIILENNENKPVTNSRDTQEVPAEKGVLVMQAMHHYKHHSCIFDDFPGDQ